MSTQLLAINVLQTTDAEFRAWVDALIDAWLAVGLTQTADTGQIDVATVLAPTGTGQSRGYAMFEPNDALTKPKYKFEFGSSGDGSAQPQLWLTVGWSTDGAGNFTGVQKSTRMAIKLTGGNNGVSGCDIPICHQDSAFAMLVNENAEGSNPKRSLIVIDRYRDVSDGSATADGVAVWMSNNDGLSGGVNSHAYHQCIPATGGVGTDRGSDGRFPGAYPQTTGTWGRGSDVGVAPFIPWDAGGLAPTIGAVMYSNTDASLGTTFAPSIYGVTRTYRAVAGHINQTDVGLGAILFE